MEDNIKEMMENLHLDSKLTMDDIPNLDLYMDQVIQLFENKYAAAKRNEEEKILTKTMINNYSKGKLFFPIKNKKYSPEHVMLINMIYEMKTSLSIRDIKQTLDPLNNRMMKEEFELNPIYEFFLELTEKNLERFSNDSNEIINEVKKSSDALQEDDDYWNKFFLILSFVNMSNYYRRVAEALVDEMKSKELKKD